MKLFDIPLMLEASQVSCSYFFPSFPTIATDVAVLLRYVSIFPFLSDIFSELPGDAVDIH